MTSTNINVAETLAMVGETLAMVGETVAKCRKRWRNFKKNFAMGGEISPTFAIDYANVSPNLRFAKKAIRPSQAITISEIEYLKKNFEEWTKQRECDTPILVGPGKS